MSTTYDFTSPAGTQLFADTAPSVLGLIRSNFAAQATMFAATTFTGLIDGTIRVDSTFTKLQKSLSGTFSDMPLTNILGFVAAPIASPSLSGTPLAPTASAGTSTTQIATTAFVANSFAPLASPNFSGTVSGVALNFTGVATALGLSAGASGIVSSGGISVTSGSASFTNSGGANFTGALTLGTGTGAGNIYGPSGDAGDIVIYGGPTSTTSYIAVVGASAASNPGQIFIQSASATTFNSESGSHLLKNSSTNTSMNVNTTTTSTLQLAMTANGTAVATINHSAANPVVWYAGASSQVGNFSAAGNFTATGTIQPGSDARWKKNIVPISKGDANAFTKFLSGLASTYLLHEETESLGFVAQEVLKNKKFGHRLVRDRGDGFYNMDYMGMIAPITVTLNDVLERLEAIGA